MHILDGKKLRDELLEEYKQITEKEHLSIGLDIILVGNNEASEIYVRNKLKYSKLIGVEARLHRLEENTKTDEILNLIDKLNKDKNSTGIILQSPTPKHIDFNLCVEHISPNKDVDGFTTKNIINLYHNNENILPCTVKGIIKLLEHYKIDLEGKNVVIVGRGEIVGKPLSLALENRNATVTLCHSKTTNLKMLTKEADILISAVGKKNIITSDMVKDGFIGIDVGITKIDGKIYGDFDYENLKDKASYITPNPGGVGPMTIAMIMDNLIYMKRKEEK